MRECSAIIQPPILTHPLQRRTGAFQRDKVQVMMRLDSDQSILINDVTNIAAKVTLSAKHVCGIGKRVRHKQTFGLARA